MLFSMDPEQLTGMELVEDIVRLPEPTARQYGFDGGTLDFLTRIGLPSAQEYEIGFYLPQEFDAGFVWDCSADAREGWVVPDGLKHVVKIGNFPINAVTIDPDTGVVYQYTEGGRQVLPIHGDLSSLVRTMTVFLDRIASESNAGDDDPEYVDARRRQEVDALMAGLRAVDPLPFAHEYSEWVELFNNLHGGMYT